MKTSFRISRTNEILNSIDSKVRDNYNSIERWNAVKEAFYWLIDNLGDLEFFHVDMRAGPTIIIGTKDKFDIKNYNFKEKFFADKDLYEKCKKHLITFGTFCTHHKFPIENYFYIYVNDISGNDSMKTKMHLISTRTDKELFPHIKSYFKGL